MEKDNQIFADFFAQKLNIIYNFDYTARLKDSGEVDFYLESPSVYPKLDLQLKTIDRKAILNGINNKKACQSISNYKWAMIDYNPTAWIQQMIIESQNKYSKVHNQLILLLHPNRNHPNPIFQENDIEVGKLSADFFKGIYYVIPSIYKDENGPISPMFVIIKDAFFDLDG